MAQVTDRTIGANPTGFDMRTELNNIIAALESDNSGASEPLNPVPYMKWLDTSNATYYYVKERNHDNTAWVTLFRYTVATKIMEAVSNGVVLKDTAIEIHNATSKTTPIDDDEIGIWDSVSSTLKKLTWANLKDTLKTYFDTLYVTLSGNQTITGVKTFNSNTIFNNNVGIGATASSVTKLRIEQPPGVYGNTSQHIRNSYAGYGTFDFGMESDASMIENIDPESHWISSSTALIKTTRYRGVAKINYYADGGIQSVGGGAIGYGTGSGGTVTQLTSKSTAVTLNKTCGYIVMNNAALAAGASVTFLLYTSTMSTSSNDLVVVNIMASSVGNHGNYSVRANSGAGGAFITLKNESAGSLSEAVIIDFAIIKGAGA